MHNVVCIYVFRRWSVMNKTWSFRTIAVTIGIAHIMYNCVYYLPHYELSQSKATLFTAAMLLCECYKKINWRDICTCECLLMCVISALESLASYVITFALV
jgi:hypothetical protein